MLVTGAGSILGVGIIRALQASVIPIEIIAIDTNPYALGLYLADKEFLAPVTCAKGFYAFVKNLCKKFEIKAIFIGSNSELAFYANKRRLIEESTGARVFVSSPEVIKICNDKWRTMGYLAQSGFQVPKSIRYPEDCKKIEPFIKKLGFPLIVKPRSGRGSEGVNLIHDREKLWGYLEGKKDLIIQEYLPAEEEEFTVGICLNSLGKVISKIALKRSLHDGVSIAAVSKDYHDIADYCAQVACALGTYGAINIQLRLKNGNPVIFEINPRFSSSTGMRLLFGINEPENLIRAEVLNQEVIPELPESGLVLRQYTDYFFPLDELNNTLNQINDKS